MKILFICTANVDRSKTAELYFSLKYPELFFKSAGTSKEYCSKEGSTLINQSLINWCDYVICMESKHEFHISKNFHLNKPVETVNILDNFSFNSNELIQELESKVNPLLSKFTV